jgi:hypothetical protein
MAPQTLLWLMLSVCWIPLVLWISSRVDGWHTLAQHYRVPPDHFVRAQHHVSGTVGGAYFRVALSVTVRDDGLYLAPPVILRPWKPPLLIPWQTVEARFQHPFPSLYTRLMINSVPGVPVVVPTHLLEPVIARLPPAQIGPVWILSWRSLVVQAGLFLFASIWFWYFFG